MTVETSLSSLADTLPEPILLVSPGGDVVYANRAYGNTFDLEPSALVGTPLEELVRSTRPPLAEYLKLCARSRELLPGMMRLAHPDGEEADYRVEGALLPPHSIMLRFFPRTVASRKFVVLNEKVSELNRQIARRRRTEQLLREQKEWLFETLASVGEGLIAIDSGGRVKLMNAEAERLTGWSAQDAIGQPVGDVYLASDDETAPAADRDEAEGSVLATLDRVVKRANRNLTDRAGRVTPIQETAAPIRDEKRGTTGSVLLFRDVTRERDIEDDLRQAKEDAEAANRAKTEFLASVSHELRTPMNVVIGMTDLVLESELDSESRDHLSTVRESAGNLLYLLDDLLDLSKIEARKIDLDERPFRTRDVIYEAVRVMAVQAAEKRLELCCFIDPEVPRVVRGDAPRLRQVLLNLIGNAIKFTSAGEVSLVVTPSRNDDDSVDLRFEIRDTGIGISQDDQTRIFSPFVQADSASNRLFGGTGLGLSIVSALISRMGGSLSVDSQLDAGSTFHFALPYSIEASEPNQRPSQLPDNVRGARVLVVDDRQMNLDVVSNLLTEIGAEPSACGSGELAIERVKEAGDAGQPFEVVIVDGTMPEMDGRDVIERIPADGPATILMISPIERRSRQERFGTLPTKAILDKPVMPGDLLSAIKKATGAGVEEESVTEHSLTRPDASDAMRVLLAEDTPANQKLLQTLLRRAGHNVVLANDGLEAVELHQQQMFDVILMDVQMPRVDGFEATRRIRSAETDSGSYTPIIALSAHAMSGFREKCLEVGMDDYMAKPFTGADLHERMVAVTSSELVEALTRSSAPEASPPPSQDTIGDAFSMSDELTERFLLDFDTLAERIEAAVEASDPVELEQAAHSLRGSSAFVKAQDITEAATLLEQIGASGKLTEAKTLAVRLRSAIEALRGKHSNASSSRESR